MLTLHTSKSIILRKVGGFYKLRRLFFTWPNMVLEYHTNEEKGMMWTELVPEEITMDLSKEWSNHISSN